MTEQNQTPTEFAGEMQELIDDVQREAMAYGIDADGQEDMARYIRFEAIAAARQAAIRKGIRPETVGLTDDPIWAGDSLHVDFGQDANYGIGNQEVLSMAIEAHDEEPEVYPIDPRTMSVQQRSAFLEAFHHSMGTTDFGERMAEAIGFATSAGWEAVGGYVSGE